MSNTTSSTAVATFRKPCGELVIDDESYYGPLTDAVEAAEEDANRYGWQVVSVTLA